MPKKKKRKRHAHERSAASRKAFDADRRSKAYKNFLRREARGNAKYELLRKKRKRRKLRVNKIQRRLAAQRRKRSANVRHLADSLKGRKKRRAEKNNRWIQSALSKHKKGALHRMLGVPLKQKIPVTKLRWAANRPGLLGKRARLALNLRGLSHKRSR